MSSVPILIDNRSSGHTENPSIPINGKQQTFAHATGDKTVTANYISINRDAPANVTIIAGPKSDPDKFTITSTPVQIASSPTDITQWVIRATQN